MARSAGVSVENNFVRGLLTEVTGVNSPENSVVESLNTIYDRKGRAFKRPAFQYEPEAAFVTIPTDGRVAEFLWDTVVDGSSVAFAVVQYGRYIYFYEAGTDTSLSASKKSFEIDLEDFRLPANPANTLLEEIAGFASGNNLLFVTHPSCEPFYVQYDLDADDITTHEITIEIRDFKGVEDGLAVNHRPSTLSEAHKYNLYNQGWYAAVAGVNVLSQAVSPRPSNADVWYYSRTINTTGSTTYSFDWSQRDATVSGKVLTNTRAASGHFIFPAFQTARTGVQGEGSGASVVGPVPEDSTRARPSCVAFYTGRVFYAGVAADGFSNKVYFSQIIEGNDQVGRCYQVNDPTSEDLFDIVASDGGVINLMEVAQIVDLRAVGSSLLVFATNGVWEITGADRGAFKATEYVVSKISPFPALSRESIVLANDTPFWWNYEGIYTLAGSQAGVTAQSVTLTTIQSFFDAIPSEVKPFVKGQYNDHSNLIVWVYPEEFSLGRQVFRKLLVLDLTTNAFYPLSCEQAEHGILGLLPTVNIRTTFNPENVTDNDLEVVTSLSGENVYVFTVADILTGSKVFKYLTHVPNGTFTFSEMSGLNYADWSETAYRANFLTGYRIRGNLIQHSQTNYLVVVAEEMPEGSVFVRGVWDYTTDGSPQHMTVPQQAYFRQGNHRYHSRKLKIRGRGRSLQFQFEDEPLKPFCVIGWAGFETVEETP